MGSTCVTCTVYRHFDVGLQDHVERVHATADHMNTCASHGRMSSWCVVVKVRVVVTCCATLVRAKSYGLASHLSRIYQILVTPQVTLYITVTHSFVNAHQEV
jgi:hypothetical protein